MAKKYTFCTTFLNKNFRPDVSKNATLKARKDIQLIAGNNDYSFISRYVVARNKITTLLDIISLMKIQKVKKGSIFLIQYPEYCNIKLLENIIIKLKNRGCSIILLIHDISGIRYENDREKKDEKKVLELADVIISHNKKMTGYLQSDYGLPNPIINLEIFDYLTAMKSYMPMREQNIIVAGSLRKERAGYLKALIEKNPKCSFAFYGNGYNLPQKENVKYHGAFLSDELPGKLNGRWGLVWDGTDTKTCSGNYGEYLKINNPHKTSLYIAAGIPVIVWSRSAMADYVRDRGVGLVVDDIEHLSDDTQLTDEEYQTIIKNVGSEAEKIRTGYYTAKALKKAEQLVDEINHSK